MKHARDGPAQASKPDISRLKQIYRRYVSYVYTLCLRLLTNIKAAEDATVETFVRFNRELTQWWNEIRIRERLRDLAINSSLIRVGDCRKENSSIVDSEKQPNSITAEKAQKQFTLGADTYESLIEQLPDTMRIAILLRDREGLSNYAIANHLRMSETDVRRLLHQARMELRRMWLTKD